MTTGLCYLEASLRTKIFSEPALSGQGYSTDPDTASGKVFLDMLGVFAEFKTNLCRERQLEEISAA
jgi:DNA invertase Pin-like site-specific DNA recombinase